MLGHKLPQQCPRKAKPADMLPLNEIRTCNKSLQIVNPFRLPKCIKASDSGPLLGTRGDLNMGSGIRQGYTYHSNFALHPCKRGGKESGYKSS